MSLKVEGNYFPKAIEFEDPLKPREVFGEKKKKELKKREENEN